jgi:hypothetical protein
MPVGVEPEDDDDFDEDVDLSKAKVADTLELLSGSVSERRQQKFVEKMQGKEATFMETYVRPQERSEQAAVDKAFIERELAATLRATGEAIRARAAPFEAGFRLPGVDLIEPMFRPAPVGLAAVYAQPGDVAFAGLFSGIDDAIADLGWPFARPAEVPVVAVDYAARWGDLLMQATRQLSATEFIIDLSFNSTADLISEIACFFVVGLRTRLYTVFAQLSARITKDSTERADLVPLDTAIRIAHGTAERSDMRAAASYAVALLKDAQLAALLRYLSNLGWYLREWYYDDALVRDAKLCLKLAGIAEDIECKTIRDPFDIESIPEVAPPVPIDRFVVRVQGAINGFLESARLALIQGEGEKAGKGEQLWDIARLFVHALVTLENGNLAPLEVLWDVFDAVQTAKVEHSQFPAFLDIIDQDPEVNAVLAGTRKKVVGLLYALLKRSLFPYAIMFTAAISPPPKLAKPFYWSSPASILKLAGAFRALDDVAVDFTFDQFETLCDELS